MFECPCILDKQINVRPTRCNKWWFIVNQLFLNMFRASVRPSSGEQTACHCLWCSVLADVVVPESRVARSVHCEEDVAWARASSQCTFLVTRLPGATTSTARTEHHRKWQAVCSPEDGRKDPRNMLRNNWLTINHHLLHLVFLTFIWEQVIIWKQNVTDYSKVVVLGPPIDGTQDDVHNCLDKQ
jgi:hypothetical protein